MWEHPTSRAALPRKPGSIAAVMSAGSITKTATMWGAPPPTACGRKASTFPKQKQSPVTLFSSMERMIPPEKVTLESTSAMA